MKRISAITITCLALAAASSRAALAQSASWDLRETESASVLSLGWSDSETILQLTCETGADTLRFSGEIPWSHDYPPDPSRPDSRSAYDINAFPIPLTVFLGPETNRIHAPADGWPNDVTGVGLTVDMRFPLNDMRFETLRGNAAEPELHIGTDEGTVAIAYGDQGLIALDAFWQACTG